MKQILIKPIITEKTLQLASSNNQYSFMVNRNAGKIEIKNAITKKFEVTVENVTTLVTLGKKTRLGKKRIPGMRQSYKKAIVTLKKGDSISLFDIK